VQPARLTAGAAPGWAILRRRSTRRVPRR
jgi:hypothetical protein